MQELENNDSQTQTDDSTIQPVSETPEPVAPASAEAATEVEPSSDTEAGDRPSRTLKLNKSADDSNGADAASSEPETPTESGASDDSNNEGGGRGRRGRQRRGRREPHVPSENPLSLTELKTKSTQELIDMANEMGIENVARSRKQDIIFSILKKHAKSGEDIWGDGVLEILSDGFGFPLGGQFFSGGPR